MTKKISRREFLAAAGVSATAGILAACAPQVVTQVVQQTGVPQVVTQVVKETSVVQQEVTKVVEVTQAAPTGPTNELGVTLPADGLPLDQQFGLAAVGTTGGGFGHIMESLYNRAFEHSGGWDNLTSLDIDTNVVPIACESWKVSEDGLNWDFALRKELVYSDGVALTANDWVFTLQRAMSNQYDFGWFYFDIKNASKVYSKELPADQLGITAVDDYTLRITTEAPTPYLPAIGVWFAVAPKHAYDKYGENWALDPAKFVSSGPFILSEFERGVKHTWVLNKNYKGVRKPYWIELRERTLPTGLPAYLSGDIQGYAVDGNSPAGEVGLVNSDPTLRAESHPQPSTFTDYIGFNSLPGKAAPLDNPDVRMALCKAVDKESLIGEIFRGFANTAYGILPKGFPDYSGDKLKELDINKYDPDAAKALLSKAGFPDGKGFPKFEMWIRQPNASQNALTQAVQARWKENLGIQVELKPADFQSFTAAAFTDKTAPMYYVGYALDYYDPATFLNVFRNGGRHPVENKDWTDAYNKANAILDPAERFKQLADIEAKLVESANWLFLAHPFSISIWPCNLAGLPAKKNKDGYQFAGGGGPGCPHAFEGQYWSTQKCR